MWNFFPLVLITLFACLLQGCHATQSSNDSSISISIKFFATDLSGCDLISKCDASVTIMCTSMYSDWKVCGSTKQIQNDDNPNWPEVFTFDHQHGTAQRWRLDLIDHDWFSSELIASFPIIVDEYAQRTGNLLQNEVPDNRGILWVHRLRI